MQIAGAQIIPGILLCAGVSFFFALAESALFALGKWQLRQLGEARSGRLILRLLENPSELLATIVMGNTLANSAVVALALWPVYWRDWPVLPTVVGVTLFILIGCEILPKTLAVRQPERWSLRIARPLTWLHNSTVWLQRLVESLNIRIIRLVVPRDVKPQTKLSDEDYRELFQMAFEQGTLAATEKEILMEIIQLDRKTAKDVMRPRPHMATISDDLKLEEMQEAARRYKHRRLPMFDETPDTIIGLLNTKALLLNPEEDLEEAVEFPSFVPETMNLLQLLISLQRQQRGVAIVLDEYGGTAGLVTVEDILEEMVGEIQSEEESPEFVLERLGSGRWRVNGALRIEDFREEYPPIGEVEGVDTIGGLLMSQLEVVPGQGQSATFRGLRLTAWKVDDRHIQEVLVERTRRK